MGHSIAVHPICSNWNNISQTFHSASFFVAAICSQNPVGSHGRHQNRLDVDTVRSRSIWIGSIETGRINGQTVRAETGLESSRLAHQILNERDAMRSEVVARFGRVAQKESRPATSAQSGDNCNDDHREPAAHFRQVVFIVGLHTSILYFLEPFTIVQAPPSSSACCTVLQTIAVRFFMESGGRPGESWRH